MQKAIEIVGSGLVFLVLLIAMIIAAGLILLAAIGLVWTIAWLLVNAPW